ncbi:hypothetical protein EGT07_23820 [Herbaspirillum sp. HC18]|nr:hypothetical protein EGT07_23820 [Herbaspirillum sp. HC18]
MKKLFVTIALMISIGAPQLALADDWGCEVLLCLANPAGPTAVAECKPPIQKLWKALAKGKPFPTCTFLNAAGSPTSDGGNYAAHSWASEYNCAPGYVVYPEEGSPYCALSGVVAVTLDNKLNKKVWWGKYGSSLDSDDSMVEENYAPGSTKSDLELAYEYYLAKKAAEEAAYTGGGGS